MTDYAMGVILEEEKKSKTLKVFRKSTSRTDRSPGIHRIHHKLGRCRSYPENLRDAKKPMISNMGPHITGIMTGSETHLIRNMTIGIDYVLPTKTIPNNTINNTSV